MTDTQPAAQVEEILNQARRTASDLEDDGYSDDVDAVLAVCDALEAAQREIAELRAERDRNDAAFAQGSEMTVDADDRLHLAEGER